MKPTCDYKYVELPNYREMSIDELLVFVQTCYKYGYEYGLEVSWYVWTLVQQGAK